MARRIDIHPQDPQPRAVRQVVSMLVDDDALIAYPTDSCYALGARLDSPTAADRIRHIRRLGDRHHFTIMCADFAQLGRYVLLDNAAFRAIKAATPGPYTFILTATKDVPRRLAHRRRTVGVRIPDHRVAVTLVRELGMPLLTSTLLLPGDDEPMTEGWQIADALDHQIDAVVDAGECGAEPTTVVDWSTGYPEVVRVGAGDPDRFG